MSLSFVGPHGSYETRWISYAMLRDNILHHLEHGKPTPAFDSMYRITEVLGGGDIKLPAKALRGELLAAKEGLGPLNISEFAISQRTKAAISLSWPLPDFKETQLARETMGDRRPFSGDPKTLGELFDHFISTLLRITEGSDDSTMLTVSDL